MRNILLEISCTECGKEISPRHFFKKSKLSISLDDQSEVSYKFVFIVCSSRGIPKYIGTKMLTTCFYLI